MNILQDRAAQPGERVVRARGVVGSARYAVVAALALLATACLNPGAYPVDVFPELHYQPSQRLLEPHRLAPPPDAVPVTGRAPRLTFAEAAPLENPVARTPEAIARGFPIYQVNCAVCHGPGGDGRGVLARYFANVPQSAVPPVDFREQRALGRTDGELYWVIANGVSNMPPFGEILTEEEIWHLVHVIREVQGQ